MTTPLQEAIKALKIADVYLRETRVKLHESYDPKLQGQPSHVQVQIGFRAVRLDLVTVEEDGQASKLFRVQIGTTIRVEDPRGSEASAEGESNPVIVAGIESIYVAEYLVNDDLPLSPEAQSEFAQKNAIYHVWPYWREYIQSTCSRFSLPNLTLPMFSLSQVRTVDAEHTPSIEPQ